MTVRGTWTGARIASEGRCATLTEGRTCLFGFEQRRWRHFGDEPSAEALNHVWNLIEVIREKDASREVE